MRSKEALTVITYLFPYPDKKIVRGGNFIFNSLDKLSESGVGINVIFYVPITELFSIKRFRYKLNNIQVLLVYYIPRISKLNQSLDLFCKRVSTKLTKLFFPSYFSADVYYYQTFFPSLPMVLFFDDSKKHVAIMRGSDIQVNAIKAPIKKTILKSIKKVSNVLSVSQMLHTKADCILNKKIPARSNVLYTYCNFEQFKCVRPVQGIKHIYFIGALVKAKGIWDLLHAFKELLDKKYDIQLHLIGSGLEKEKISDWIQQHNLENEISLLGKIPHHEISTKINNFDVMIFPSHSEGLPNVVVESVACERIIIATNVGGTAEICASNLAFQLLPPKQPDQIVTAFEQLYASDITTLQKLTQDNRAKAFRKFNDKAHINTLKENLFND